MAAQSAKIVDLNAYRETRRKAAVPAGPAAAGSGLAFASPMGLGPMMMWVPVWTFVPVAPGPWTHAR